MTVPLIPSQPISPFGFVDDADLLDAQKIDRDGSYVPGWSEMRREYDTKIGQFNRREISFDQVPVLPVNQRWARVQNLKGEPSSSKAFTHNRNGYRFVSKDDIGKPWFTEIPGGAFWNAAGQLQNGDGALMVCDGKQAGKNQRRKEIETAARVTGVVEAFESNLRAEAARAGKSITDYVRPGSDPYMTKETSAAPAKEKK